MKRGNKCYLQLIWVATVFLNLAIGVFLPTNASTLAMYAPDGSGIAQGATRLVESSESRVTGSFASEPSPVITRAWTSNTVRGPEISEFPAGTGMVYVNYAYENPIGSIHGITWYDSDGSIIGTQDHIIGSASGIGAWSHTYPGERFWPGGTYKAELFINDILLATVTWTVVSTSTTPQTAITRAWTSDSFRGPKISEFPAGTGKIYVNYAYENPMESIHGITWYDGDGSVIGTQDYIVGSASGIGAWNRTYPGEQFWPRGTYKAELFINDILLATVIWTVEELNHPPVANIDLDLARVSSGYEIDFNASQSSDPDGTIVSYEWDFGDGTAETGAFLSQVNHRFRGAMNEPKSYQVTLTVRDDQGAAGSDTAEITVRPLEKTIEIIPPPRPVPSNAVARMTAYYNWVGETEDTGEDIYLISKIQFEAQGYISYALSIWDEYSFSIGIPMWSKGFVYFWQPVEKSLVYPFGTYRDRTYTFDEGYFEGIAVGADDIMRLWAFNVVEISRVMVPTWDGASISFAPDSAQELITDETPPNFNLAYLCSAGELRVYDSRGNVTGLVNGEVKQEISDSGYCNDFVAILNPSDSYYYKVVGIQEGLYGLGMASVENGEATNFMAIDIPITSKATHQYTVDWDALSQGEEGVTMKIDSDGDGTFEDIEYLDQERAGFSWVWVALAGLTGLLGILVGAFIFWRRTGRKQVHKG